MSLADNTKGSLEVSSHELRVKTVSLVIVFSPVMSFVVHRCRPRVGSVSLAGVRFCQEALRK